MVSALLDHLLVRRVVAYACSSGTGRSATASGPRRSCRQHNTQYSMQVLWLAPVTFTLLPGEPLHGAVPD